MHFRRRCSWQRAGIFGGMKAHGPHPCDIYASNAMKMLPERLVSIGEFHVKPRDTAVKGANDHMFAMRVYAHARDVLKPLHINSLLYKLFRKIIGPDCPLGNQEKVWFCWMEGRIDSSSINFFKWKLEAGF